ncbi:ATP-binding protein [Loktanella sp. 3ANDIMAR09]|uniref:DNA-packaging protein n=1 Tax=Loktanella sp. 3ANDIMAR09 TaxID=1225657 RepID=UPI0006F89F34|nr:terminase family protein [Loktanella sp. 3ANDIMAR09]KQI69648.1 ATP-binding protein [Loktanella sp. 3ANDIMAR09]
MRSGAHLIASGPASQQKAFLAGLSDRAVAGLPYLFDFWAMAHQVPPDGDWRAWVVLGGRGAGKTRAGAEWVRAMAEGPMPLTRGRARRIAIIGETYDQAREVMVMGDSGIVACSPDDRGPKWIAGRKLLRWPNGAEAQVFSAFDPEALRGPQFDAVWADEVAKWKNGSATWDMVEFGLRLGACPQAVVTTTPRNAPVLKEMLARSSTVVTHATTFDNVANLAPSFLAEVRRRYGGTRLGRQELDGVLLDDAEGALWTTAQLDGLIRKDIESLERIVVAVDPPVTGHKGSDACGIIVAGVVCKGPPHAWRGYVLEDASVQAARPLDWAKAAVAAYHRHGADRLVAEVNQGGDMVETIVRQIDPLISYRGVNARRGKIARAEPVAALYEQMRIKHARGLGELEDQMCLMTRAGFVGQGSPDRVDALVWAMHELMIAPAKAWQAPRLRRL